jgi:hypothetical protein
MALKLILYQPLHAVAILKNHLGVGRQGPPGHLGKLGEGVMGRH